jgi:Na+/melibiose symporter-like transporter
MLFSLMPALLMIAAALLLVGYRLTRQRVAELQAGLHRGEEAGAA